MIEPGQNPDVQEVLFDAADSEHDHIMCNQTAIDLDLPCNMPPARQYRRGSIVRCRVCGQFALRTRAPNWTRISTRRALRRLRKAGVAFHDIA